VRTGDLSVSEPRVMLPERNMAVNKPNLLLSNLLRKFGSCSGAGFESDFMPEAF